MWLLLFAILNKALLTVVMMTLFNASLRMVATPASRYAFRGMASVGDKIPSVDLQAGWPPQKHNLADFAANKKIILMGLPGAFTPTVSADL